MPKVHIKRPTPSAYNLDRLVQDAAEAWFDFFSINEILDEGEVSELLFAFEEGSIVDAAACDAFLAAHDPELPSKGEVVSSKVSAAAADVIEKIADSAFDPIRGMNAAQVMTWYEALGDPAKDTVAKYVLVLLLAKLIKDQDFDVSLWVSE